MENNSQDILRLKFSAFKAVDRLEECHKYIEGHMHVLKVFGITQITSAKIDWILNPNVYVILVEDQINKKVLAGARIQIAGNEFPLPIEDAVGPLDSKIFYLIKERLKEGTAEFCGLWNSWEIAGLGIGSIFLGRAGISILNQLHIKSLFALCAPATLRNCLRTGFLPETILGINGTFYYPKEDLIATALIIDDVKTLVTASSEERQSILDLRMEPRQTKIEITKRRVLEIEYDLLIK